ncbi:RIP metalloprotease RseP [bacterium DOLZORAL124_64_63]|nr:MAG: RIP metalloprotease RseP [bacterium DOLZORAL124_64_63]
MYNVLMGLLGFALALVPVVVIHELGHFLFCKLFGVYVKTFSIGIGPKILRRRLGETEYVLSAIPFGGYVKMAGEGLMEEIQDTGTWEERKYPLGTEKGNLEAAALDEDIPPERLFFNRPAWQRGLVFIAGPFFNLILAFLVFSWVVFSDGIGHIPTTTAVVSSESVAAAGGLRTGDVFISVDGQEVHYWEDIQEGLYPLTRLKADDPVVTIPVTVERDGRRLDLEMKGDAAPAGEYWARGLSPWYTTVGMIQRGGKAEELGLRTGDTITALNGETVRSFADISRVVGASPDVAVEVTWLRGDREMKGVVVPQAVDDINGQKVGRISIAIMQERQKVGLLRAAGLGLKATTATIVGVKDFFLHKLSLEAVGGPLRIAQAAGETLRWSFTTFLNFVAFFSVNLFLLNLLPIPVLDGGHVLFLVFEVLRGGKPVPERLQAIATQIGLIILLLFMTFVIVLDVWKVSGH